MAQLVLVRFRPSSEINIKRKSACQVFRNACTERRAGFRNTFLAVFTTWKSENTKAQKNTEKEIENTSAPVFRQESVSLVLLLVMISFF
jgi:hypothetical protein